MTEASTAESRTGHRTEPYRVLIVDDEAGVRFGIRRFLERQGFEASEAASCSEAEKALRERLPDVAVIDYQMPDGTALELLPRIVALDATLPVVVITGHGTIDLAVRAMRLGAAHFLTKPVELPALQMVLERVLEQQRMRRQQAGTARSSRGQLNPFAGGGPGIRALEAEARRALETQSPVLIGGETGTGKGVLARWLYQQGPRSGEAWVDLNCVGFTRELLDSELFGHERGAFTGAVASKPGLLEVAHRGTVFLDEVGDMDIVVQGKLLKAIEEKRFRRVGDVRDRQIDVRVIAATHRDLMAAVRSGGFREDLFYRLSVIELHVPALRDRPEDLLVLAHDILARLAAELGREPVTMSPQAESALAVYPWPGNLRELRNVLERALLRSERGRVGREHLGLDDSPPPPVAGQTEFLTLAEMERRHITRALEMEGGHVERAAQRLGVPRSSLYQKLKAFGIRASGG